MYVEIVGKNSNEVIASENEKENQKKQSKGKDNRVKNT